MMINALLVKTFLKKNYLLIAQGVLLTIQIGHEIISICRDASTYPYVIQQQKVLAEKVLPECKTNIINVKMPDNVGAKIKEVIN